MVTPVGLMLETLKRYMHFCLGIVFGVPLQIGSTSCRDGNKGICSSLGHGHPKSKSLFHTDPVRIVSWASDCSGVVDDGVSGVLLGMKARGKFVLDHNEGFAPSLIEGTTACGYRVYPVYEANFELRSQSLFCTCAQEGGAESMGGASGRAGEPSIGGEPLLHPIGGSVSDSCSVNSKPAKNDRVCIMLPTFYNSSQTSHALRQALPVWISMETSHPFIQFSSCLTAFTQGGRAAERVSNVLQSVPVGAPVSYLEQSGMCNYIFAAYTLIPTTILCQWILIAAMSLWFIFNLPRSSWKSVKLCSLVESCVTSRHQSRQRALIISSGSYLCQAECIPTFENLSYQGMLAFGRWTVHVIDSNNMWTSSVLSVSRRSMTSLLHSAWGPNPPNARELRLCRLFSSIAYLSSIYEDYKYRVLRPFGSWDMFMILVMVLTLVGMLALYAVHRKNVPLRRSPYATRSRTMRSSRATPRAMQSQSRTTPLRSSASSVQSTVSPVVPQGLPLKTQLNARTYMCLLVLTLAYMCLHVPTCAYMCLHVPTCAYLYFIGTCLRTAACGYFSVLSFLVLYK